MGIAPAPFGKMYVPLMVIAAIATKITLDGYYEQCFLSADRNSYKGALTHSVFLRNDAIHNEDNEFLPYEIGALYGLYYLCIHNRNNPCHAY